MRLADVLTALVFANNAMYLHSPVCLLVLQYEVTLLYVNEVEPTLLPIPSKKKFHRKQAVKQLHRILNLDLPFPL